MCTIYYGAYVAHHRGDNPGMIQDLCDVGRVYHSLTSDSCPYGVAYNAAVHETAPKAIAIFAAAKGDDRKCIVAGVNFV